MDDEPLNHVLRQAPPWRRQRLTECGLHVRDDGRTENDREVIDVDELRARLRRLGKQRVSVFTCMTCWTTAARNRDWATDPLDVMTRGAVWSGSILHGIVTAELRALEALVRAHPEEFYGYLDGLEQTRSLQDARAARRRRGTKLT